MFSPEKKAGRDFLAWMHFGAGPRNCIGMRFAIMEAKIELVRFLRVFTIHKCSETKVPLPFARNTILGPAEGEYVTLEKGSD